MKILQDFITFAMVGTAALYLLRNALRSWQAFRNGSNACESGCGKCGGCAPRTASTSAQIIPLTQIKTLSKK